MPVLGNRTYANSDNRNERINIPQKYGPKGGNGATPVKGIDYFTEEDKAEMIAMLRDELLSSSNVSGEILSISSYTANVVGETIEFSI